jgi:competence protein ComEC
VNQTSSAGSPRLSRSCTRQPLLWAALAYAAGLGTGLYAWRPPSWWIVAFAVFNGSAIYFLRRRAGVAFSLGLAAIFVTGALAVQVRNSGGACGTNFAQFGDDEVQVTAHVTAEGNLREDGIGSLRQRLDVETEQITAGDQPVSAHFGVRVSIYQKESTNSREAAPMRLFGYGERLRFPAKLFAPRNFGNPGAFDYHEYLAEHGIAVLASTKAESIEALPGFAGSRVEFWRSRIHRSIIEKVHQLWPKEAGLMDAMVIGEDAFIGRPTRVDFQRSGTYHVLVVSGMNVTILAMVTFWTLRRLRLAELAASVGTMLLTVSYAVLTNVGPPIWRATLMLIVYLFARWLYREKCMLNAIGAAALALMVANPRVLFGASFELTFLCVWLVAAVGIPLLERTLEPVRRGLRYLDSTGYDYALPSKVVQFRLDLRMIAGRLHAFFGRRVPLPLLGAAARVTVGVCELVIISLVMQVGLVLPMAYYFHRATVVALPANMLVVPLTEVLMPSAVLALALGYISLLLAKIPALIAGAALAGIAGTVHRLGGLQIVDARVPTPGMITIITASACSGLAMILIRRRAVLAGVGLAVLAFSVTLRLIVPTWMVRLAFIWTGKPSALVWRVFVDVEFGGFIVFHRRRGAPVLLDNAASFFRIVFAHENDSSADPGQNILLRIERRDIALNTSRFKQAAYDECFRFLFGVEHPN